jgi:hypothetical protein
MTFVITFHTRRWPVLNKIFSNVCLWLSLASFVPVDEAQEKQEREAKAKRHDEQAMNVY